MGHDKNGVTPIGPHTELNIYYKIDNNDWLTQCGWKPNSGYNFDI